MTAAACAALAAGSVAGGLSRWLLASRLPLPWGTLAVNVSACFLAGLFDAWTGARGLFGAHGRLLLLTGFCGAYSTFSTLLLDSASLAAQGQAARALALYLGSGAAGFLALRLGALLGRP